MYAIKADLRLLVFFGVIVQLLGCATDLEEKKVSNSQSTAPLFTLLPAAQTKIDFQNTLTEGLNTNILMYEYFYNGGGVAVGDFNGDGLEDLYFTANMEDNKMYLNKGNLQFEDVTLLTGAQGRPGPWKTGVTAVDINGDHLLDLYICYSGALPEAKRTNQLFINKGNNVRGIPLFEDEAEKYGLASPAHSTQAYFFDYDHDHDLDMLLLNHNPKNLPILNEESTAEMMKQDDPLRSTRLYRQTNGRFEDVTIQSGINGSPLSYGLGLGISDLNADGWPDFYISNDYAVPDYLYINNQDGTFTNQISSLGHISEFSMGNDIVDFNNDGWQDIFTLDMLPEDNHRQKLLLAPDNYAKFDLHVRSGFYYQYMRNMLQLNNGNGSFSEIGQLAGISNTDWSWSALLADFDEDGYKDLHVTNGYKRDYTNLDFINYMDDYVKTKGRLVREDVMDIIGHMPASNVSNYIFANQGDLSFKNLTTDWGLNRPSNSNG
ncbi:MAG: VCBS repeat-containing protein, partial [Saprospiraceae bacterium]